MGRLATCGGSSEDVSEASKLRAGAIAGVESQTVTALAAASRIAAPSSSTLVVTTRAGNDSRGRRIDQTGCVANWRLDERTHAGGEHLDPGYVAGYERKAGFDPAEDLDVLRRQGLSPDSVVVDMGAGTGVFTGAVAPLCRKVIAVDVSPAMIAALCSRVEDNGLSNVSVVEAGLLSYDHDSDPVDMIYTRNVLHHLPDFWKAIALQRLFSILRPGGVLRVRDLVFDFEPGDAEGSLADWLAGAVTDATVGFTAEELATHVRTEFSTYSWLFEPMLERVGFTIVDRNYTRSAYGAYTCMRPAA